MCIQNSIICTLALLADKIIVYGIVIGPLHLKYMYLNLCHQHKWASRIVFSQGSGWCGPSSLSWVAAVYVITVAPNTDYNSNNDNMRSTSLPTEKFTITPLYHSTSVRLFFIFFYFKSLVLFVIMGTKAFRRQQ